MAEKIIETNGVEICTETFGNATDPCILLIMGATASMIWWDEAFCRKLGAQNRFVIRYDNRDVGRSSVFEELNYDVTDMAADAFGVLDFYAIEKAHLVGMSLGGMLAQIMALQQPERVLSLTLIASSVWANRPELPQIDPKFLQYHSRAATLDWEDKAEVQDYLVGGWKLVNGSARKFDVVRSSQLAFREIDRANSLISMFNHAMLGGGEAYYDRSSEIKAPVLIIHGTEDPILPYPHALALQEAFPGAKLLRLEGVGHELHEQDWELIIQEIVALTAGK
ncbi:alpha/beta hydrolase [Adhaeribacter sp. BT258]|uniref:Alpha/beta hydrolase n=1 Tax=Adhaeribacter terrigena TaxID=2793070 RepID=A0ABS1BXA1_9BACT|nr:alpha/beta hydrolase [Adhaeribacter terrigena]MBK0401648.1 alpha/beta hydrolase [Adhaeribacter terrigena]